MDQESSKPRWAEWGHRPSVNECPQSSEADIRAFLTPGTGGDIPRSPPEQPPPYPIAGAASMRQGEGIPVLPDPLEIKSPYKALPPPFQSTDRFPIDGRPDSPSVSSPSVDRSRVWDELPSTIRSPYRPYDKDAETGKPHSKTTLRNELTGMFQGYADAMKPAEEVTLDEWLRAAVWWAVRGTNGLENGESSTGVHYGIGGEHLPSKEIVQALMDLAKAWWICHQVVDQDDFKIMTVDPRIKDTPRGTLLDQYKSIITNLRPYENRFTEILCGEKNLAAKIDVDRGLWVFYSTCSAYDAAILDDGQATWSLPPLAFGDTSDLFCYQSQFVEATLFAEEEYSLPTSFSCMLSIVRDPSSWETVGIIASQTQLVHIEIKPNRSQGPAWKDIEWDVDRQSMLVKLRRGFFLNVKFHEDGFKVIWDLAHQVILTDAGLVAGENEDLLFDETVNTCQYINHDKPVSFPAKPAKQCRVRLLKKTATVAQGAGERKAHRGFRIVVATPPCTKQMHRVSHNLLNSSPVSYSLMDADDGSPGLLLHLLEDDQRRSLFLYFDTPESRTLLHSLLLDLVPGPGETAPQAFPICSYVIAERHTPEPGTQGAHHIEFGESLASVIEQEYDQDPARNAYGKTVLSQHLRVIVETEWGSITDRINIGPGQLTIALSVLDNTVLHIHRHPQKDLSMTVAHGLVSKDLLAKVADLLPAVQEKQTLRRVKFETQDDLHKFQEVVTGFKVLFDGIATRFLVTRRRKLLPIMKQWDANLTRIQVVQQGSKIQIVAFFYQFHRWKCLNFMVKTMDEFERVEQKGEWGLKIKDAKYALPQADPEVPGYVCLDELEFPTEHDDIAIMFQHATVRESFAGCLPGSVSDGSRGLLCR